MLQLDCPLHLSKHGWQVALFLHVTSLRLHRDLGLCGVHLVLNPISAASMEMTWPEGHSGMVKGSPPVWREERHSWNVRAAEPVPNTVTVLNLYYPEIQ